MLRSCDDSGSVECFADPCAVTKCAAKPDATCLRSYCNNGTYQGQSVGPCGALFVDADGAVVDCDAGTGIDDINT